jgi:hypothetical protein
MILFVINSYGCLKVKRDAQPCVPFLWFAFLGASVKR